MHLPDLMSKDEIQKLFMELFTEYINNRINDDDLLDIFLELSYVEINKNELIDIRLRNLLDNIVSKNCTYYNIKSKKNMLLHIIVNFQLLNSFDKIKSSINYWIDKDIMFYEDLKYSIKIAEKGIDYILSLSKSR